MKIFFIFRFLTNIYLGSEYDTTSAIKTSINMKQNIGIVITHILIKNSNRFTLITNYKGGHYG